MSFIIGQNTLRTKQLNRTLVFQTLLRLEAPTRQEIAAFTKLTPATITNIVSELMEEGYVVELGSGVMEQKRAGRKTVVLGLNEEKSRVAAIHIRSDRVEMGIVTLKGNVKVATSFPMPAAIKQEDFLKLLKEKLGAFLEENKSLAVACLGIGSVGLVDYENGRILEAEHLEWKDVGLVTDLSSAFDMPVYLDHHVRGMTLAEKMFGSAKNESDFLCVFIGQGIGAGLFLKDQLYRSNHTGAGEIGHMTYQPEGKDCWCGNKGCLERYASEEALMEEVGADSVQQLIDRADKGETDAVHALQSGGKRVGVVLSSFLNMLHVRKIVLGGELARQDLPLLAEINETIHTRSFLAKKRTVEIVASGLGENQGMIGAACIAIIDGVFTLKDKTER